MSDTIIMYENGKAIGGEGHPTNADEITFDNSNTNLVSEEVESAIKEVNAKFDRGSVSVTADGTKTWAQIFATLYALIDTSKINSHSKLLIGASIYNIRAIATGALAFTGVSADPANMVIDNFVVNTNVADCHYYSGICTGNPAVVTAADYVSNVVAPSTVVAIEY